MNQLALGIWFTSFLQPVGGWSGGAMVLGKLPVPGRPTILNTVGQGPTALAVGAGGGCLDIFILIYPFSSLSPSLWETARYRLKYCLKGPLNPKQPTNLQPVIFTSFNVIVVRMKSRVSYPSLTRQLRRFTVPTIFRHYFKH